jgi:hypothetical protein
MAKAIKRAEHSKINWHHSKVKGTLAYMCPACKEITYLEGSYSFNLKNVNKPENSVHAKIVVKLTCDNCGHIINNATGALDPNIAPVISELNKKGYYTLESCEGHQYDDEKSSQPYIWFTSDKIEKAIKNNPLPEGFYIDKESKNLGKCIIKYNIHTTDKKYPGNMELVHALLFWARRLPNAA